MDIQYTVVDEVPPETPDDCIIALATPTSRDNKIVEYVGKVGEVVKLSIPGMPDNYIVSPYHDRATKAYQGIIDHQRRLGLSRIRAHASRLQWELFRTYLPRNEEPIFSNILTQANPY